MKTDRELSKELSELQTTEICGLYSQGISLEEVARISQQSPGVVRCTLERMSVRIRKRGRAARGITAETVARLEKIEQMRKDGYNNDEISRELKCSRQALYKFEKRWKDYLEKHGN